MKILIDPGHGGHDNGAAYGFAEEDDLNLSIGYLLSYELQINGHETRISRQSDIFVSLADRVAMANEWPADLFVSVHCDAFHKKTASGMSVHIYERTTVSEPLGRAISDSLAHRFPDRKQRGVRRSNFQVIRETDCPACLVECEFLSNPDARKWLTEPSNQIALARTISAGVQDYEAYTVRQRIETKKEG
ncbi:MAG: N-acetylmuramoyl-L-alanine amidase [Deltaproteobacteria bacterium]|nr:N-acetylmuramoyl-L-alanine amidase [Deltaproteobacteria bacterium]